MYNIYCGFYTYQMQFLPNALSKTIAFGHPPLNRAELQFTVGKPYILSIHSEHN